MNRARHDMRQQPELSAPWATDPSRSATASGIEPFLRPSAGQVRAPVLTPPETSPLAHDDRTHEPEQSQASRLPKRPPPPDRLRELVRLHLDFLWRNLRRVGNAPADADEIVQEAFLVASRKLDEIRPGSERSYLLAIAMNIASTRRRSYSREIRRIDGTAESLMPTPCLDPEQAIEQQQARQELDAVLLSMNLELRTVFVLYELEELSTKEIAGLLEIKEGTVASRLRRAREEFRATVHARSSNARNLVGAKL